MVPLGFPINVTLLAVAWPQALQQAFESRLEPLQANTQTTLSEARPERLSWYALRVRTGYENPVAASLEAKGLEYLLPTYRSVRRWSDRLKSLDRPLFPCYLFCRFDISNRAPVLTSPGVIEIVGAGRIPVRVPDQEIMAIQSVVRSGLPALPWQYLTVGSAVYITRGPLAGLEGLALNVDKKYRLVVSVALLQRSVAVEIDRSWVRPVSSAGGRTAFVPGAA